MAASAGIEQCRNLMKTSSSNVLAPENGVLKFERLDGQLDLEGCRLG
jgi:hypothetical protein